jgi:hypothetical protein
MKREEIRLPRHFWRWRIMLLLLVLHILIYGVVWISAFSRASNMEYLVQNAALIPNYASIYENQILLALFWTPVLFFHVGAHLYLAGRSDAGAGERQAYREGFHDGARYSADDVYDARPRRRLEIDEDGELVDFPLEGKQKRR